MPFLMCGASGEEQERLACQWGAEARGKGRREPECRKTMSNRPRPPQCQIPTSSFGSPRSVSGRQSLSSFSQEKKFKPTLSLSLSIGNARAFGHYFRQRREHTERITSYFDFFRNSTASPTYGHFMAGSKTCCFRNIFKMANEKNHWGPKIRLVTTLVVSATGKP